MRTRLAGVGLGLAATLLAALLVLPLLALVLRTGPATFREALAHPLVGPALQLSLLTTFATLVIIVLLGTPLAWHLARSEGRALRTLETALQLPVVMPPAVAGVALLLAFGRNGLPAWLGLPDASVAFTTTAVVIAQVFVAAPLYLQSATAAFRRLDPDLLAVGRSLGASPVRVFFELALPLAGPGLRAGAGLAWARALGEFGATLMFAGSLAGVTQTLPLAIYAALEADVRVAQALSVVLMACAFAVLVLARRAAR